MKKTAFIFGVVSSVSVSASVLTLIILAVLSAFSASFGEWMDVVAVEKVVETVFYSLFIVAAVSFFVSYILDKYVKSRDGGK